MSAPVLQFMALLAVHWVADFVLQSHWQASNKSKRNDALFLHVMIYMVVLLVASLFIFGNREIVVRFALINAALHFATDYFTSRASSKLYAKQDWHNFFVVIGFDQLIHQATLGATMLLLLNPHV